MSIKILDSNDIEAFRNSLEAVAEQLQMHQFQFGNEPPFQAELYHQLRENIENQPQRVQLNTDYPEYRNQVGRDDRYEPGIKRVHWFIDKVVDNGSLPPHPQIRDGSNHFPNEFPGEIIRTRTEVSFVIEGRPLEFTDNGTVLREAQWEEDYGPERENSRASPSPATYDFVVFADKEAKGGEPIQLQTKHEGMGEYFDVNNQLSILCECKHSKNYRNSSYSSGWKSDLERLAKYPGEVDLRAFVFMDIWPRRTGPTDGVPRYDEFFKKVTEKANEIDSDNRIVIFYIPRESPPDLGAVGDEGRILTKEVNDDT